MFFDGWYGLLRVLIVGPLAYIGLVLLLRTFGKRTLSKMNAFDFVVTVAIGSMLASIILTETVALIEGLAGMTMLIVLQFTITWLSVRSDTVANLVKDEPSLLYHQGRYLESQMKKVRVTKSEMQAAVRETGKLSIDEVDAIVLETDGTFYVMSSSGSDRSPDDMPIGVRMP